MDGSISFDSNSLQTYSPATRTGIVTNDIQHTDLPPRDIAILALANANLSVIPYINYPSRKITIAGAVIGSSQADLDSRIDTFKKYFNGKDKNLDIAYGTGTRRYTATVNTLTMDRKPKALFANFAIEFVCTLPFGVDTSPTTALNASNRTNQSYVDAHTFSGNAPCQLPLVTITYQDVVTSAINAVTNPGFETDLSGWSSGGIGTASRVTTQHHSGVAAMQMVNASSSPLTVPSANTYGWELYLLSGLTPGVTYTVKLWVKGNAGGETIKASTLLSAQQTLAATTSWQQISFTFVATASTDQIYVWSTTSGATWFLDDVSVSPSVAAYVSFQNSNNGQGLMITDQIWSPGDVLTIDVVNKSVKKNGVEIDFLGALPEFPIGSAQSFSYSDGFVSRQFSEVITYYPLYL